MCHHIDHVMYEERHGNTGFYIKHIAQTKGNDTCQTHVEDK
jgi:hypothetical protein